MSRMIDFSGTQRCRVASFRRLLGSKAVPPSMPRTTKQTTAMEVTTQVRLHFGAYFHGLLSWRA